MSSMRTAPPQLHAAPSPHRDLELTGLRGCVARRPLTAFLVIALGLSWLLFCVPVLAFHGVPGANLPVEAFALRVDAVDLAAGGFVGHLDHRWTGASGVVRPAGDRAVTRVDLRRLVADHRCRAGVDQQLGSIVLAVVVINRWEETVWAGFFQTCLPASTSSWPPF
jgi:uncharacterized protein